MVLRGRLDLRCVRMSKSFQVIDSHNALIQVISTTAELAAKVATNCGLPAFRVSFLLRQCSTLTGADRSWLKLVSLSLPCVETRVCECRPAQLRERNRPNRDGDGNCVTLFHCCVDL